MTFTLTDDHTGLSIDSEYRAGGLYENVYITLNNRDSTDQFRYLRKPDDAFPTNNSIWFKNEDIYYRLSAGSNNIRKVVTTSVSDLVEVAGTLPVKYDIAVNPENFGAERRLRMVITSNYDSQYILCNSFDNSVPREYFRNSTTAYLIVSVNGNDVFTMYATASLNRNEYYVDTSAIKRNYPSLKAGDVISVRLKDAFCMSQKETPDGKWQMYLIEGEQPVATYTLTEQDIPPTSE